MSFQDESFYRSLFENEYAIMLLIDAGSGRIVDANRGACLFYGWTQEQLKTMVIWDINTLSEDEVKEEMRLASLHNKKHFNFRHKLASKEIRDVEVVSGPIYIDGRSLLYTQVHDITDRNRIEDQARRHSKFEQTMLHLAQNFINMPLEKLDAAVNDVIKVIVDYCGARRATLWKYDWLQNVSENLYEYDRETQSSLRLNRVSIDHFSDMLDSLKRGEVCLLKFDENEKHKEYFIQTGIKSTLIVPLLVNENLIGTFTISINDQLKQWGTIEINTVRIFTEMLTNVLQRKESAQALIESMESHLLTLDSVRDGIAMVNREGTLLNVNAALVKRFHTSKQSALGKNMSDFCPVERYGDLNEQRMKCVREAFDTCKPIIIEDCRDGIYFENRFYPVIIEGVATAVTLFSTDISYRKKAEEEAKSKLEYQTKLSVMTEFFTNISHELKTPLSVIFLQYELMERCINDAPKLQKPLAVAKQNSYRLARLVGNLLDLTKIDAGYMKNKLENVDLVPLLKDICKSVESYVQSKSIQLDFSCTLRNVWMVTDLEKLERIMYNLLSNAIKHTGEKGRICVKLTSRKGKGVRIVVEDTGEGIPKNKLKVIFDRFAQVESSVNRHNEGTGIGLSLVKSLVEMLNGSIRVKSELNKGSQFYVHLPEIAFNPDTTMIELGSHDLRKKAEMELADLNA